MTAIKPTTVLRNTLRGFFGLGDGGVSGNPAASGFASRGGLTGVDATGFLRVSTLSIGRAADAGGRAATATRSVGDFCGVASDAAASGAIGVGGTIAAAAAPVAVAVPQNGQNLTAPNSGLSH
ncbi:hypothetical protein [Paraburkholderia graminis]|uniref:hypothetical protein n=1 Tax=Paraburkholderia graminis TaxID=60548 RepID=UPI0004A7CC9F|nr:hypothetical protein [Paraburkholderia graminis]